MQPRFTLRSPTGAGPGVLQFVQVNHNRWGMRGEPYELYRFIPDNRAQADTLVYRDEVLALTHPHGWEHV